MYIKQIIKDEITKRQQKKYFNLLEEKTETYDAWIKEIEKQLMEDLDRNGKTGLDIKRVPFEVCESYLRSGSAEKEKADVLLFLSSDGKEAGLAGKLVEDYFLRFPNTLLAYGDEDVMSPEGVRYTPWFKPHWSPDTFLSGFYFGSIIAVRTAALRNLKESEENFICRGGESRAEEVVSRLCFVLANKNKGFERRQTDNGLYDFPIGHIDEILFHSFGNKELAAVRNSQVLADASDKAKLVTVIIPSKDNAEMLKRCVESVTRYADMPYEIIVVDNGSCDAQRRKTETFIKEIAGKYIYEQMPFHFSRMCNMGAEAAAGDVLLFLNDDVEVPALRESENWMSSLAALALRAYTGAIGVKLLYPNTEKIQHAGIVNVRLGPVHKLQFKNDNICYYYGWNRGNRNVSGVTGACLAISAYKFKEAGGFSENLPVAFNDVELCFALYEKGYYNTVCQDIALYHYESLSRGQDEDENKIMRLLSEKRKLYEMHGMLYARDPFYHKYLAGDMLSSGFESKADYEWREEMPYAKTRRMVNLPKSAREDRCVISSLEFAGSVREWKYGKNVSKTGEEPMDYYIQGYAFVSGSNNACYKKKILLQGEHEIIQIYPEELVRKDVEENLPDQINVGLTGFAAKIENGKIEAGNYRIGILAEDKCSRQKLYSWTNRFLEAEQVFMKGKV